MRLDLQCNVCSITVYTNLCVWVGWLGCVWWGGGGGCIVGWYANVYSKDGPVRGLFLD